MKLSADRVTVTDPNLAEKLDENVVIGEAFAFLSSKCFEQPGLSWLARLFGKEKVHRNQILSLLSPELMELPGVSIAPGEVPQMHLSSITSDRDLYRNENDNVHLLVINALLPKGLATVNLFLNNQEYSEHSVDLDKNGAGQLVLRDLPVGDYKVKFPFDSDETACGFTVAEYKLVPLVASMVNKVSTGDDNLVVTLSLESFGQPVDGEVKINLLDRATLLSSHTAVAREGMLQVKFQLKGAGPHSLAVILAADPLKTASVPLTGSRAHERSRTIFSRLGTEVTGSLLPSQNSRPVRGIFIEEGTTGNAPLTLEKVDAKVAKLRANVALEQVLILAIDPTHPNKRPDAPDSKMIPHPAQVNQYYKRAEELFGEKKYAEALAIFARARDQLQLPHPYFAYFAACCHAKLEHTKEALAYLRLAFEDGWADIAHMAQDEDLEFVRDTNEFKELLNRGRKEFSFESVTPGQVLEVETTSALTILAIGTYVDGKPWEGWASVVNPEEVSVEIKVAELCEPGKTVVIGIDTPGTNGATIYAIVKDARLLSSDTPVSRLAARIKSATEEFAKELNVHFPTAKLDTSIMRRKAATMPMLTLGAGSTDVGWGAPPGRRGWSENDDLPPAAAPSWGSAAGMDVQYRALPGQAQAAGGGGDDSMFRSLAAPSPMAPSALYGMADLAMSTVFEPAAAGDNVAVLDSDKAPKPTPKGTDDSPTVLYAGFVPLPKGSCTTELAVKLPDKFSDYLVDVFVIAEGKWARTEHRFTAARDPFADLTVPVFAAVGEQTYGQLTVGSRSKTVTVKLSRNGEAVEMLKAGAKHDSSDTISGAPQVLTFLCPPGDYEAVLEDEKGKELYKYCARVSEPGKLKRKVRALKLLEAGQSISIPQGPTVGGDSGKSGEQAIDWHETITGLSLLPGLDTSFEFLTEATASYAHCCCEQTAAKLLSACTMYMFASSGVGGGSGRGDGGRGRDGGSGGTGGGDDAKRRRAESIIDAGIRREESMWLRGQGFKGYPEMPNTPDMYVGPRASKYLWNVAFLKNSNQPMSKALSDNIEKALMMARDTAKAYKYDWPPKNISSCEDAYAVMRFTGIGTDGTVGSNGNEEGDSEEKAKAVQKAVDYVRSKVTAKGVKEFIASHGWHPVFGRQVLARTEAAYAAACLLRGGSGKDKSLAIELSNLVIGALNEQKMLYSTVDSVAAIALMSELENAKVTGGGIVEIDGEKMSVKEALEQKLDFKTLKVVEGVASVEVAKEIMEDWSKFSANVPMRLSLQKDGQPAKSFTSGDSVDLHVVLEDGYKDGDLLWVCLPDALSRIVGGGQVKLFSIDFKGKSEVRISLAATGITTGADGTGSQKYAVCVRNMFNEERAGSPGMLEVTVRR